MPPRMSSFMNYGMWLSAVLDKVTKISPNLPDRLLTISAEKPTKSNEFPPQFHEKTGLRKLLLAFLLWDWIFKSFTENLSYSCSWGVKQNFLGSSMKYFVRSKIKSTLCDKDIPIILFSCQKKHARSQNFARSYNQQKGFPVKRSPRIGKFYPLSTAWFSTLGNVITYWGTITFRLMSHVPQQTS